MPAPDYSRLIDAETWAFIHETARWYPSDAANYSIPEQRAVYDRMCRAFHRGYPAGVVAADSTISAVPVRIYTSGDAATTVVYFHGGGFMVGGLESHDDICAEICAATGLRVVSVDYRLAPENPHPAAFDDCLAVTKALAGGAVILVGDSAGGALAAAVTHAMRGEDTPIIGQVLIYPTLSEYHDQGSYLTHAHAPMLTRDDVLFYVSIRHKDGIEPQSDPTATPLSDTDFTGLPPTVIVTAECDPLSDDGFAYHDSILSAGGRAHWVNETGLVHGYLRARSTVARAAASFGRITQAIGALARHEWPY